ncbi:MAG: SDR family oxidoreductase [Myxococcales bacterium]|nr:SDR family oxidoreductase [Myxococcales bacterium]
MRNVVITGASSGIGRETAKRLVAGGHRVLAVARRRDRLEQLRSDCAALSGEIFVESCDLTSPTLAEQLLPRMLGTLKRVDVLINNAGAIVNRPFAELSDDDWALMWKINVMAPVHLIRAFLPHMGRDGVGHVVNLSSMGGVQGSVKFPGLSAYSSAKAALAALTECLAVELVERSVHVNCVALGAVQTEMLESAFPGYEAPLSAEEFAVFLADFAIGGHRFCNGTILPMALSTP